MHEALHVECTILRRHVLLLGATRCCSSLCPRSSEAATAGTRRKDRAESPEALSALSEVVAPEQCLARMTRRS